MYLQDIWQYFRIFKILFVILNTGLKIWYLGNLTKFGAPN